MFKVWFVTLALLVCAQAGEAAAQPAHPSTSAGDLHYTVYFGNRQVGPGTVHFGPDGEETLQMKVQDRGRGEELTLQMRLDRAGLPVWERLSGYDYWKNPVDERFERTGKTATWSNALERGTKRLSAPAFYILRYGSLLELSVLAKTLLHSPAHRLPLLPEGEARIERISAARVEAGGEARDISIYAVSGLTASALHVWMEGPGRFFGYYDGFITIVPEGWDAAAPVLIKAQVKAEALREKAQAARLGHRPAKALAIRGARLFDPETRTVRPGTTVVISGNRIQAVGPDGEVPVPAGAEVVKARGRMLLPGLWDMHRHFTDIDGILDIAAGVTTGRDMANDTDYLLGLKHKWDTGEAIGPRVVMAGVIEGPGPYAGPTKVLVDTEEKARAAVDRYAELGYAQIKIYNSLDPKLVPAIAAEAHARGLRVSGHIPNGMIAEQAVRAGFDEIQHTNFLFLNFIPGVDTRTPARMSAVAEHAAEIDLHSEPVRAFLRLLKEHHTVVDPTVSLFEDEFTGRSGQMRPSMEPVADRIPYQERRTLPSTSLPVPPGMEKRFHDSFQACLAMVKLLYDEGIPIVAGTDSVAGFVLHRELENYVRAGIPAPDVLRIATLGAARVMKLDKDLGTVAPAKLADLILVDGDPTVRISDIRRVTLVVKDGVVYDPAKLYAEIGIKPAVPKVVRGRRGAE
ncbi:MAG TPA: amidohydrolase family protein [Thermoanaerobaculia bacterium]|nr:amidohydrolase family protein [Thermoanaerobaculia bacterium]